MNTADGQRKCKYCAKKCSAKSFTSSLEYHVSHHHPEKLKEPDLKKDNTAKLSTHPDFRPLSIAKYDGKKINDQLLKFFTTSSLPFIMADNPEVRDFVRMLNPSFNLPTRNTIESRILSRFEVARKRIKSIVSGIPGRFSLTTDMWTSTAQESFVIVTAHWISSEWKLHRIVLDFIFVRNDTQPKILAHA